MAEISMTSAAAIPDLPHPVPPTEWVGFDPQWPEAGKLQEAFGGAWHGSYWQPKTVAMHDGRIAIDLSADHQGNLNAVKVARIEDHPFLKQLPSNSPRTIKHIYRRETRMRYLRSWEGWDFLSDMRKAESARAAYNDAIGSQWAGTGDA